MTFEEFMRELEEVETLKQTVRSRTMVYQADLKEQKARDHRLPFNAYYGLSFEEWSKIRDGKRR